jgi:hypothetical protein
MAIRAMVIPATVIRVTVTGILATAMVIRARVGTADVEGFRAVMAAIGEVTGVRVRKEE